MQSVNGRNPQNKKLQNQTERKKKANKINVQIKSHVMQISNEET